MSSHPGRYLQRRWAALRHARPCSRHAARHAYHYERTKHVCLSQLECIEETASTLLTSPEKCRDFATLNYMALLDAMEADDNMECKAAKRRLFFEILSHSRFFRQYLKLPRDHSKRIDTVRSRQPA
jgi:hypothetical protein